MRGGGGGGGWIDGRHAATCLAGGRERQRENRDTHGWTHSEVELLFSAWCSCLVVSVLCLARRKRVRVELKGGELRAETM